MVISNCARLYLKFCIGLSRLTLYLPVNHCYVAYVSANRQIIAASALRVSIYFQFPIPKAVMTSRNRVINIFVLDSIDILDSRDCNPRSIFQSRGPGFAWTGSRSTMHMSLGIPVPDPLFFNPGIETFLMPGLHQDSRPL
jgi:hypothetical protein